MALEFVFIVATERPELLPGRELIHLWENIILYAPQEKPTVQSHVYAILDHKYYDESSDAMSYVHQFVFEFLGNNAVALTSRDGKPDPSMTTSYFRSILLRMEHAILSNRWTTRYTCSSALATIAFTSIQLDVRQHIYEFFVSGNVILCSYSIITSLIHFCLVS